MYRLLIANPSEIYTDALVCRLKDDVQIRTCNDGLETLTALNTFQPDIFFLHTAMPCLDSLTILRRSRFVPRIVLASTNYVDRQMSFQLHTLGVQQLMLMPSVSLAQMHIRNILKDLENGTAAMSYEYLTAMHLQSLQFQAHLDGYRQLCVCIPFVCRNPEVSLTKTVYPTVADALGLTDGRAVERSVRSAIESAWLRRNTAEWSRYFPAEAMSGLEPPTNKQFIGQLVAELLRRGGG